MNTKYHFPETPTIKDASEMSDFFINQVTRLSENIAYSQKDIEMYKDWHSTNALIEKILDPNRFFSVLRDNNNTIIGYFESKPSSTEPNAQAIQWTLIDEKHMGKSLGMLFAYDFHLYCLSKGVKKMITFIHEDNTTSQIFREQLGFQKTAYDPESHIFTLEKYL